MNKMISKAVENIGKVAAKGPGDTPCLLLLGQPKMPKCLVEKEMQKDAE